MHTTSSVNPITPDEGGNTIKQERAGHRTVRPLPLWSLLLLCGSASIALGGEQEPTPSEHPQPFALTVQGDRLSLTAQDAPIKAVLEELGRKLHVEIIVKPPQDETITTKFQGLTLDQALQRLSERYAATKDRHGRIIRVVVIPKGQALAHGKGQATAEPKPDQPEERRKPEPFRFEFDPSAYEHEQ